MNEWRRTEESLPKTQQMREGKERGRQQQGVLSKNNRQEKGIKGEHEKEKMQKRSREGRKQVPWRQQGGSESSAAERFDKSSSSGRRTWACVVLGMSRTWFKGTVQPVNNNNRAKTMKSWVALKDDSWLKEPERTSLRVVYWTCK